MRIQLEESNGEPSFLVFAETHDEQVMFRMFINGLDNRNKQICLLNSAHSDGMCHSFYFGLRDKEEKTFSTTIEYGPDSEREKIYSKNWAPINPRVQKESPDSFLRQDGTKWSWDKFSNKWVRDRGWSRLRNLI